MTLFRLTILCAILVAGAAAADYETRLREGGPGTSVRLAGNEPETNSSKVYIVQLRTPSAATMHARMAPATPGKFMPGTLVRSGGLNKDSALIQSHVQLIEA